MRIIIKKVLISVLFINGCTLTYSQNEKLYLDTLHIRIENKMELLLATYDYAQLGESVEKDLKIFQDIMKQDWRNISEEKAYSITYEPGKELSIKENVPVKKIILENNEQILCVFNDQCKIAGKNYTLLIRCNSIENLFSENLITKIKEAKAALPEKSRWASTYNLLYTGDSLTHNQQMDKVNGDMDYLDLRIGMGASLIKNQPVTDFSMELGFLFNKKGIVKNNYYFSDNLIYLFDGNQHIQFNNFLNIGYRYNLSNELKKKNWLGIELGYLTTRNGDFFNKNTFKIGLNWGIGNSMSVATNFYLSNGLKNMYPGIRIGFGF